MGLAQQLRDGTRRSHTSAERTSFVKGFLRGVVSREQYAALMGRFWHVYQALETALDQHADHPAVAPLHFPALRRQDAILRDLKHFSPCLDASLNKESKIRNQECLSPATAAYVARLQHLADRRPDLLSAHSYVRYLGDLSGGQILKGITVRALRLPPGAGVDFYEFPLIPDHAAFKTAYRAALDSLPLTPESQAEIIAEANLAFQLNIALFNELSGSAFLAFLRSLRPAPALPPVEKKVETRRV